ncbi:class I SAM-dependent methyltransferase [Desulfocurvus sp. DL9XJH121]
MLAEVDGAQVAQKFLVEFMEPDGMDVLEVGCGDGRLTAQLAGWPATYAAVDTDEAKLEDARNLVPEVAFSLGSGEALDFADESFDVVLFSMSLHHQDPELALAEAHRVLRPGGRAVVLEPVAFSEAERVTRLLFDEQEAYRRVQEAMASGPFAELKRELFRTEIRFPDLDGMLEDLFERYHTDFDPDLAEAMADEVGDKASDAPLVLNRDLVIVLLGKV